MPSHSLCNFEEVFETFLTQYASHREAKRNNHHLLTVKMSQSDNLKSYIGYFQSQLDTVPNCDEDFSTLVFISGLQFSHPLYNHLLKHNVNQMSEALSRAQPYIQLEEAMMTFANHSAKRGDDRGKSKSPHEAAASESRAICLQETSAPDPLTKSALSLQADRTIHSVHAPHQRNLQ